MEDSVEIVIEKLLHVSKDSVPKVTYCMLKPLFLVHPPDPYCFFINTDVVYDNISFQVSSEAEQCLTTVLSQYDPFRCLSVCS